MNNDITNETPDTLRTEELLINMGPQHPSTHGVLRLIVQTDGEMVRRTWPQIGFLHRCFEKIAETLDYAKVVPYTDRMDYLASMNSALPFCLAVEKLGGFEVPDRASYLRVIMAELNRIASHLMAFGCYALDLGAFTPFLYGFRERETILSIFEKISGGRLLYHYPRVGGVARVGVLRQQADERPFELLVQRGEHERQRRLGHPRTGRHRLGKLREALVLRELADEGVENGTVHERYRLLTAACARSTPSASSVSTASAARAISASASSCASKSERT